MSATKRATYHGFLALFLGRLADDEDALLADAELLVDVDVLGRAVARLDAHIRLTVSTRINTYSILHEGHTAAQNNGSFAAVDR